MEITPDNIEFSAPFTSRSTRFMTLENKSPTTLAFKIKTTAPNTYSVRPNCSIIYPGQTQSVAVHHQGFPNEPDHDYVCNDKFMVLWAPVLNLSKLDELDQQTQEKTTITQSPSDQSITSNRSSASSILLALIDDISGYWRRLEEESYDVINKKKIKVVAHVFSKSHDGVVQDTEMSTANNVLPLKVKNGGRQTITHSESLKSVKESLKDVKASLKEVRTTPNVDICQGPFTPQMSAPRSISLDRLSAFTTPCHMSSVGSLRDNQMSEVNQKLTKLTEEIDQLRQQSSCQAQSPNTNVTNMVIAVLLCFSLLLVSLNSSKLGVAIGLAQTFLMASVIYIISQPAKTLSTRH